MSSLKQQIEEILDSTDIPLPDMPEAILSLLAIEVKKLVKDLTAEDELIDSRQLLAALSQLMEAE